MRCGCATNSASDGRFLAEPPAPSGRRPRRTRLPSGANCVRCRPRCDRASQDWACSSRCWHWLASLRSVRRYSQRVALWRGRSRSPALSAMGMAPAAACPLRRRVRGGTASSARYAPHSPHRRRRWSGCLQSRRPHAPVGHSPHRCPSPPPMLWRACSQRPRGDRQRGPEAPHEAHLAAHIVRPVGWRFPHIPLACAGERCDQGGGSAVCGA
jgi:hypothetical protein